MYIYVHVHTTLSRLLRTLPNEVVAGSLPCHLSARLPGARLAHRALPQSTDVSFESDTSSEAEDPEAGEDAVDTAGAEKRFRKKAERLEEDAMHKYSYTC